jgi:hypothetical protein
MPEPLISDWLDGTRNNGMDTKKIFRIIIKNYMENSTNEVCIASRSYCRVGKITPKRNFEVPRLVLESETQSNN